MNISSKDRGLPWAWLSLAVLAEHRLGATWEWVVGIGPDDEMLVVDFGAWDLCLYVRAGVVASWTWGSGD